MLKIYCAGCEEFVRVLKSGEDCTRYKEYYCTPADKLNDCSEKVDDFRDWIHDKQQEHADTLEQEIEAQRPIAFPKK
jgi:macrodomain Ter protein organizer (MatP/YcbG family)